jgi:hypothetical protein
MTNFHILFEDFLADGRFSVTEKVTTAGEWVGRMTLNNPGGVFSPRVTALQGALSAVEANSTDKGVKLGAQKTATTNKKNFRKALVGNMARVHAKVVAQFGKDSAEVAGVFPKGLAPFAENELQVVLAGLTTYQAQLTTGPMTDVGGYISSWLVVYNAAKGSKTAKVSSGASGTTLMKTLQIEMTKTALFVAFTFPGDDSKCDLYLPTTSLFNPEAHPPGPTTLEASGGAGSISITTHASGATIVRVFQRLVGATVWVEMGTCPPDEEVTFDMLPPGNYEVKARGENDQGPGTESDVSTVTVA